MTVLTVRALRLAAVLVVLMVPTGCGGSAADSSGTSTSATGRITVRPATGTSSGSTALPSDATLHTYFDGIARGTLSSLAKAKPAAASGSPAAGYATYLEAAAQAVADSGHEVTSPAASAEVTHGDYRFCSGSSSGKVCYRYSDVTGADGKVVDFSVNGKPVGERVAVGTSGPVPASGVEGRAEFVAAFEATATGNLFVAVRVEATGGDLAGVKATYGVAGSPSPSSRMAGPRTVDAGGAGSYVFAFPRAALGGTLTLTMSGEAGATGTVGLTIR